MLQKKYKIEYLPAADRDLEEILTYITVDLNAPQAAEDLLGKIDQAVKSLETFPYAHPVYQSAELYGVPFEFRVTPVAAYLVFYYVTENIVTVARILYGKRDVQYLLRGAAKEQETGE